MMVCESLMKEKVASRESQKQPNKKIKKERY